jgi:hypothetical protein
LEKGEAVQRKDGKWRPVEGAEGKGHRQQQDLMGKVRGCAEEEWEEESRRRSGREGS